MSCTVLALPYALAWVATVVVSVAMGANNKSIENHDISISDNI